MTFQEALQLMLDGKAACRHGDNNHELMMFVKGSIDKPAAEIEFDKHFSYAGTWGIPLRYFQPGDTDTVTRLPRFDARTRNGQMVTGWTPSATDLLADDWYEIVPTSNSKAAA
ncbi:hypothetical protein CXZ10_06035 [Pleomorphomonas diazotrophica]|uniref:Thoeris anti-defense 2-like domain-containing protein n=1 Tax=Pleomorphomonas diazotrophica TaxID=1166257 RepID=A0A1I4Q6D2_9HYPH|nr:MW1434 family type I TA system toxin [Pleomorphomonas diazotrophica]PKR90904.1 hypothetical protein CXZ10_06035 [Pleomorphomonas diazotrophica]SFM35607.1 Protein of unknown function [Pleomorphomonas diazotrophica]